MLLDPDMILDPDGVHYWKTSMISARIPGNRPDLETCPDLDMRPGTSFVIAAALLKQERGEGGAKQQYASMF